MKRLFTDVVKRLAHTYTNTALSPRAADVEWISKDGSRTKIADMEPTHAKHIVALMIRELQQNKCAYLNSEGRVEFATLMDQLVDNKVAFVDDDQHLRIQK